MVATQAVVALDPADRADRPACGWAVLSRSGHLWCGEARPELLAEWVAPVLEGAGLRCVAGVVERGFVNPHNFGASVTFLETCGRLVNELEHILGDRRTGQVWRPTATQWRPLVGVPRDRNNAKRVSWEKARALAAPAPLVRKLGARQDDAAEAVMMAVAAWRLLRAGTNPNLW